MTELKSTNEEPSFVISLFISNININTYESKCFMFKNIEEAVCFVIQNAEHGNYSAQLKIQTMRELTTSCGVKVKELKQYLDYSDRFSHNEIQKPSKEERKLYAEYIKSCCIKDNDIVESFYFELVEEAKAKTPKKSYLSIYGEISDELSISDETIAKYHKKIKKSLMAEALS